jgi:NADH:ubiquinone oxidoreductase subunit 5 (subunit L)/multisubunit Na+/H+ antiporter MnhA subunit
MIALIPLVFRSLFIRYLFKDIMIGLRTPFWNNAIFLMPQNRLVFESEIIPQFIKLIPLFVTVIRASFSITLTYYRAKSSYLLKMSYLGRRFYGFLNKRWLFDRFYNDFFRQNVLLFRYHISFKSLDKRLFEYTGPYRIIKSVPRITQSFSNLQSRYIYHYALAMLLRVTILIAVRNISNFIIIDSRLIPVCFIAWFITRSESSLH